MNYGFIRVAAAIPSVRIADCKFNATQIENLIKQAEKQLVRIIVFPELTVTGYTCGDLFAQELLLSEAESALAELLIHTETSDIIAIIGMPVACNGTLLNTAVVIQQGRILGIVPKTYLPNYKEFSEKRWFASALQTAEKTIKLCGQSVPMQPDLLFRTSETTFGIEICEDLWAPIPPSSRSALNGAEIIFNMSADNEEHGKYDYLCRLISQHASKCICGYVFASCGFGESTTDTVFPGNGLICDAGNMIARSQRFQMEAQLTVSEIDVQRIRHERRVNTTFAECRNAYMESAAPVVSAFPPTRIPPIEKLTRNVESCPFFPEGANVEQRCMEIFSIQAMGLAQRLNHTKAKTAVIGISGGLDSTLALLVCCEAFDRLKLPRENIIGITMPGFGTTGRTYRNAIELMHSLGVTCREIPIREACIQHFKDIGHDIAIHDATYENSQARERTQLLMDIANQAQGIVIGTGDLSELALGWATYNGDHMSMYGVNASVPKTLVQHLVKWFALHNSDEKTKETLLDILDTPISPELVPTDSDETISQKTEDLVGPYELHDFFLFHMLQNGFEPAKIHYLATVAFRNRYDSSTVKHWLSVFYRRFFSQQFKRSCLPDGPKTGLSLSPRGDWRMPSDASARLWIEQCEKL